MCECCNFSLELCNDSLSEVDNLCNVKIHSQIKFITMKKLALCVMTASMLSLFCSTQSNAATDTNRAKATEVATATTVNPGMGVTSLDEIKPLNAKVLDSSEKNESLKEVSPLKNDQDEHGRGYNRRHRRDVDVTIQSNNRGPGYYEGRHGGGGAYIGIGGVLVLILILVLIL